MAGMETLIQLNLTLSGQKTPGVVEQYLALLLAKQKLRRTFGTKQGPKVLVPIGKPGSWELQFL